MEHIPPPAPRFGVMRRCSLWGLPAESQINHSWLAASAWHLPIWSDMKASSVIPKGILTFIFQRVLGGCTHFFYMYIFKSIQICSSYESSYHRESSSGLISLNSPQYTLVRKNTKYICLEYSSGSWVPCSKK